MLYFKKSQPAPECLEIEKKNVSGDYKCGCVLERLKTDFKNKCYICESNPALIPNVEHFKPHRNKKDLKFDWKNLFWVCSDCNNIKLDNFENILNCTDSTDLVEEQLAYFIKPPYSGAKHCLDSKVEIEIVGDNPKSHQTKELIMKVFNGTTLLKTIGAINRKNSLLEELAFFGDELNSYFDETNDEDDKAYYFRRVKKHLNKASAFTSFKRQIVKDNAVLSKKFGQYLI